MLHDLKNETFPFALCCPYDPVGDLFKLFNLLDGGFFFFRGEIFRHSPKGVGLCSSQMFRLSDPEQQ